MSLKLKISLTLIGLSAIALPIFLIAVDFSPIGYFYQPASSTKKSEVVTPKTEPLSSPTPLPLALLSTSEFQVLENDTSFLVINLDNAIEKTNSQYLTMTRDELKTVLQEESDLTTLFKTNKVILVSSDLVSGEEAAKKLMEKGLKVSIYLYHD